MLRDELERGKGLLAMIKSREITKKENIMASQQLFEALVVHKTRQVSYNSILNVMILMQLDYRLHYIIQIQKHLDYPNRK